MRQGGYGANNLIEIENAFANLAQATADDRTSVINLTGPSMNLATQVDEYANHLAIKDYGMAALKNSHIQRGINNLKRKLHSQHTKIPITTQKKTSNWWSAPY